MNTTHRIVTKSRYGFLRTILLVITFSIEYWLFFGYEFILSFFDRGITEELLRFTAGYLGYIVLQMMFVFRGHNKKVYLSYESGLSLFIKCAVMNVVCLFFLAATNLYADFGNLLIRAGVVLAVNYVTIYIVLRIINWITQKLNPNAEKILYVTAEDDVSEELIEAYESIYLVDIPAQKRNDWLKYCYEKDKVVYMTAKLSDVLIRTSGLAQDRDQPVLYCTKFGISGGTAFFKRVFDLVCSCLAVLFLWPVMLITAIAIKREDGGTVIYTQTRCTKDLKEFKIYKFRSMIMESEAETGACLARTDDNRITKVGRFIRKWKIDELPQLFNIIKGDMSIVGPRPERPELIEENCRLVPEFVLRTKVKAGLTGYAQVRGEYETDKLDKLKWDLIYIENYSLLLDLKIIVMTAIMLWKGRV